jgi:hypothetical protein
MNYMIYVINMKWIVIQKLQIMNCKWKNQIKKKKIEIVNAKPSFKN